MRRMTGALTALLTISALAGTTACGGGGGDDAAAGSPFEDVSQGSFDDETTSTTTTGEAVEEARVTIGETVRYAAFDFELGDAVLAPSENAVDMEGNPDPSVGQLTIDAVIENLGDQDFAPDQAQMYLELGGSPVEVDPFAFDALPVVPAGETGNAEIVFDGLPDDFDLDNAELVFGDGDHNQARVPLGGEGETVTLEPVEITPGPPVQIGELNVTIKSGQLVYDNPNFHEQLEAGDGLLFLTFDVAAGPGIDNEGFFPENMRLVLPDGTSLASSVENVIEVIAQNATLADLLVAFEVPVDLRGSFQLVIQGLYGARPPGSMHGAQVEGNVPFELDD